MGSRSCGHNRSMLDIESCSVWASLRVVARSRDAHCRMCWVFGKRRAMSFLSLRHGQKASFLICPQPLKIIAGVRNRELNLSWNGSSVYR